MPFSTGLALFLCWVSARGSLVSVLGYACARPQAAHPPLYRPLSSHTRSLLFSLLSLFLAQGQVFIIKPPASAEGRGIRLANRFQDFRTHRVFRRRLMWCHPRLVMWTLQCRMALTHEPFTRFEESKTRPSLSRKISMSFHRRH